MKVRRPRGVRRESRTYEFENGGQEFQGGEERTKDTAV